MIHLVKKYITIYFNHHLKALLAILTGAFIIISCYSYNQYDDCLNVISGQLAVNWFGVYGAYASDIMIQFWGKASYLLGIFMIYWGGLLIKNIPLSYIRLKILALLLCTSTFAILLDIYALGGTIGKISHNLPGNIVIIRYLALLIFIVFLPIILNIKTPKLEQNLDTQSLSNKPTEPIYFSSIETEQDYIDNPNPIHVREQHSSARKYQQTKFSQTSIFQLPTVDLLKEHNNSNYKQETNQQLEHKANELIKTLHDFGVKGKIVSINQGPVVTLYEFEPSAGTKSSRVIGLADDIARSMSSVSARISTISGRNVLGIELPNTYRQFFSLKELIETNEYHNPNLLLPVVLGKDLSGKPFVVDLAKMPHLLIAGTTGSGKSVGINTMILSLLYKYTPEECRLIMIDPKMLELSVYDDIPHLLTPVVTEASKAVVALKWAVKEMENRYRLMSQIGVRNITNYNHRIEEAIASGEDIYRSSQTDIEQFEKKPIELKKMPFIVIIVDEMADLMLVAGKDIESFIQRLAQMARAAGIHLITATQRPSVDVITGVIKANFPSRISFKVTSKIDSRTILGEMGSEQLLGMGDMLYMGNGSKITRVHGPFVDDREVEKIVSFLKAQGKPDYVDSVTASEDDLDFIDTQEGSDDDSLYRQAVQIVKRDRKCSTSYIQRCLRIGYNRAAILIERMEKEGLISEPNHSGKREIFIP